MTSDEDFITETQYSFGFCGCGQPEDNVEYVRAALEHLADLDKRDPFKDWEARGLEIHGTERAQYFFWYWADAKELTEHGVGVPGWLTLKGEETLARLNTEKEKIDGR